MRFVLLGFAVMALAFYHLSGGADYAPREGSRQAVAAAERLARAEAAANPPAEPAFIAIAPASEPNPALYELPPPLQPLHRRAAPRRSVTTLITTRVEAPVVLNAPVPEDDYAAQNAAIAEAAQPVDIRRVAGEVVNMRMGPGTDYDVVTRLEADTEVEVLQDSGDGWVELRVVDSGDTGWMADYLLTAAVD